MDMVLNLYMENITYSNAEIADCLFSSRKWAIKNENTEFRMKLIFHSVDGVEHRIDISGAETIHELSSILRRADIGANVLLFVKRIPDQSKPTEKDDYWEVNSCFKRMPNKWFITVVF